MVDLHMHSSYSDGTYTIKELLKKLNEKKIVNFSVTDHNNIESYKELLMSSFINKSEMRYLPGVELSSMFNGKELHILLYGKNINNPDIEALIKKTNKEMEKADNIFINKLNLPNKKNDFFKYDYNRARGGWKSLNYLIDENVIKDKEGFFELFNNYGEQANLYKPKEIIDIAKTNNVYAVLAHPNVYQPGDLMDRTYMEFLKNIGIMGIECYNRYYQNINNQNEYIDFCKRNNLLITGGSDYHGEFVDRKLGEPTIFLENLELGCLREDFINL